jgi:hypothetical protein
VPNPKLDLDAVKSVLSEYRIHNADVHLKQDYDVDELIDVIEGSRVYIPCIYAVNKIDQITIEELNVLDKLPHYCPVCAYHEWNLTGLVEMIFDYLKLIRIYTKPKGGGSTQRAAAPARTRACMCVSSPAARVSALVLLPPVVQASCQTGQIQWCWHPRAARLRCGWAESCCPPLPAAAPPTTTSTPACCVPCRRRRTSAIACTRR